MHQETTPKENELHVHCCRGWIDSNLLFQISSILIWIQLNSVTQSFFLFLYISFEFNLIIYHSIVWLQHFVYADTPVFCLIPKKQSINIKLYQRLCVGHQRSNCQGKSKWKETENYHLKFDFFRWFQIWKREKNGLKSVKIRKSTRINQKANNIKK